MNAITGGSVFVIVLFMTIFMVVRASSELRKHQFEE